MDPFLQLQQSLQKSKQNLSNRFWNTIYLLIMTDGRLTALHELLEDTIDLAVEEEQTSSAENFVKFIKAYIPSEFLSELHEITECNDDDDCETNDATGNDFLNNVWDDRFGQFAAADDDDINSTDPHECLICQRLVRSLTRHHVYPKETHKKCIIRGVVKETEKHLLNKTIAICRLCHSTVHKMFTNWQLAVEYNTVDALMEDDRFHRFALWNSKQSGMRNGKVR